MPLRAMSEEREPGLLSIVQNERGETVVESKTDAGVVSHSEELGSAFTVLFQKGLTLNHVSVQRNHRHIISPFEIMSRDGLRSNVPWAKFSWCPPSHQKFAVPELSCGMCMSAACRTCCAAITTNEVKVIWLRTKTAGTVFRWFVVTQNEPTTLVPIPAAFVDQIKRERCPNGRSCSCGNCRHPLKTMPVIRSPTRQKLFDSFAARSFVKFRTTVNQMVLDEKKAARSGSNKRKRAEPAEQSGKVVCVANGTCSICLEDTVVATDTCVKEQCKTPICKGCFEKTRGICPICDRTKLSPAAKFSCFCCNRCVDLADFGYPCITCDKSHVCKSCFVHYGSCARCECSSAGF